MIIINNSYKPLFSNTSKTHCAVQTTDISDNKNTFTHISPGRTLKTHVYIHFTKQNVKQRCTVNILAYSSKQQQYIIYCTCTQWHPYPCTGTHMCTTQSPITHSNRHYSSQTHFIYLAVAQWKPIRIDYKYKVLQLLQSGCREERADTDFRMYWDLTRPNHFGCLQTQ